jgi:hypothetical protein
MKKENYLIGNNSYLLVKKLVNHTLVLLITLYSFSSAMGQVAINEDDSDANVNAALDIKSTTKGVLFPIMVNASRDALKSPAAGLLIYNPSTTSHNYYDGTNWKNITTGTAIPASNPGTVGSDVGVGIGIDDPDNSALLQVSSSTKGFLLPQGNPLPGTVQGLIFYTLGDNYIRVCNGTTFEGVTNSVIGTAASGSEAAEGVLIGTGTIANSAAMEVRDEARGLLIPRMTDLERDGIESPAEGLTIYNTSSNKIQFYSTFNWYPWTMEAVATPTLTTVNFINTSAGRLGTTQTFTVPVGVTLLVIEAWGAEGGVLGAGTPGKGARMKGSISVAPGDLISIVVGQKGTLSGGGGGSFVYNSTTSQLLLAAGGGGGASDQANGSGGDGLTSEAGGNYTSGGGNGGTGGSGGFAEGTNHMGGAGAGFLSDGADGYAGISAGGGGGKSWDHDMLGGEESPSPYNGRFGGFGGGGSAGYGPGGGGGYSGGSTYGTGSNANRHGGGGGGSYNSGANKSSAAGVQTGHGQVIIIY